MKRILATSALAALTATSAFADAHSGMFMTNDENVQILGSELIGSYVYVSETEIENGYVYERGVETEWDNVGDINDIVLSRDGEIEAVVIGVGGFIGIGEKDVAVKMDSLRFVSDGRDADEYFVVFKSSEAELEGAPEWDDVERNQMTSYRRAERGAMRYDADTTVFDGMERDGYDMVETNVITRDDLTGATLYGIDDENIGEVSELMMGSNGDGRIAVLDVGGFLGMGEKEVAVPLDKLRIMRGADGDDVRVYISATQEQLENLPEYRGRY